MMVFSCLPCLTLGQPLQVMQLHGSQVRLPGKYIGKVSPVIGKLLLPDGPCFRAMAAQHL